MCIYNVQIGWDLVYAYFSCKINYESGFHNFYSPLVKNVWSRLVVGSYLTSFNAALMHLVAFLIWVEGVILLATQL
jgi:hypothetical protein